MQFYDFATQDVRPIMRLANQPISSGGLGFSVSPDERYLLYTQIEEQQSDVMLLERQ